MNLKNTARNLICKVIPVWLDPDLMEEVNLITGIFPFRETNWCNKDEFIVHKELNKYADEPVIELILQNEIDYIVFREDY